MPLTWVGYHVEQTRTSFRPSVYIQPRHRGGVFYSDRALCFGLLRKGDIMRKLAFFSLLAILLCSCVNKGVVADPASTSDEAKPVEAQESPKADESKPSDVAKDGDEVKPSDNKPEDEAPKANDVKPDEAPKASDTKLAEAPAK